MYAGGRVRSGISVIFVLFIILSLSCVLAPQAALAAGPNPPIQYNTIMTRYYKSSVDGATLPCSVFVPNKTGKIPVWVDLHAFGGPGGISEKMTQCAQTYGCIIVSPWGRNYHSLYVDSAEKQGNQEPCLFDDFSNNNAGGWGGIIGDQWKPVAEAYQQSDWSDAWKVAGRAGSAGSDYTASVDIKQLESSENDGNAECAAGLLLRSQANGDCYLVDLDRDNLNQKWLRMFKYSGSSWTLLNRVSLPLFTDFTQSHNLKVVLFEDNIEVHFDDFPAAGAQDSSFASGEVALASFGARHQFDNFRVQNEMLYGEKDVLDSIDQCLEELSPVQGEASGRADCSRIFIAGQSMGGLGAWNLGLHYPDLFAYIHPAYGSTDVEQGFNWIKTEYPDQDPTQPVNGQLFAREQDGLICEGVRALNGGDDLDPNDVLVRSKLHEYSARYLLENALNTPVRLEHAEYDTLVPNTTNPMTIKWLNTSNKWVKVKDGAQRPSSDYANSQGIWQTWTDNPGLYKCPPETSLYDPATGNPGPRVSTVGIWDNTDVSASSDYPYGAHCALPGDSSLAEPVFQSFDRLNRKYGQHHNDPDDVAYKTYDNKHNRAWWLTMEAAYPDQDKPALARIHREKASNSVAVHVKNVKTTVLDVMRMGLDTLNGTLTVAIDNDTTPESEFKVQDEYQRTDIKLVGQWYPANKGDYQVRLDDNLVDFEMSATTLTVPNVEIATGARTIKITMPAGLEDLNLLFGANPGFESGTTGWNKAMDGGLKGVLELNQEPYFSHSGGNSIRIKDPQATTAPFSGSWQSNNMGVQAGTTYTLSAFARTRNLNSVARAFENGKYGSSSDSNAGVGIIWLKANGEQAGWSSSQGVRGSNDWTPLEITALAPADAKVARVVLFTICPDNQGIKGSVWFDDVALRGLRGDPALAVSSISPASGVNTGTIDASIAGTAFQSGATVRLERGATVINATGVLVASGNKLTCKVNIASQPLGKYDVVVRNNDGQEARLAASFSVTDACGQGAAASISVFAGLVGLMSLAGFGFRRRRAGT